MDDATLRREITFFRKSLCHNDFLIKILLFQEFGFECRYVKVKTPLHIGWSGYATTGVLPVLSNNQVPFTHKELQIETIGQQYQLDIN